MFIEIEKELLSIISDEPIEKIAHSPSRDIAKTMELLYNIKFEDIKRVYHTQDTDTISCITVIYDAKDKKSIDQDLCPIKGKVYHITFFPSSLLNKDENNAITLCESIILYTSCKLSVIMNKYDVYMKRITDNLLFLVDLQVIPIITCAIMRKIYSGPSLSKVIYMSLTKLNTYKSLYTEEGVNTILSLFDEGLGVSELLESGFICSIKPDDSKYPGIWCNLPKEDEL